MSLRSFIAILLLLTVFSAGCGPEIHPRVIPTETPFVMTANIPSTPTSIALPTETSLPPPPSPTLVPVTGTTSTQVNVRGEPSTVGKVLGMIPPNAKVEITGTDPARNWWQINYPQGVEGKGWVNAQYVRTASKPEVPIIGDDRSDLQNGNVAIVQQQLNIRSGPGTDFNSLGTLNPQDVVSLIGKDANGAWLQINFPAGAGPDGKGWVNAAFVQAQGVENLPIVTEAGQVVGTGTPTSIPPTPTVTIVPAWDDHDSLSSPIVNVVFEPSGTQSLIYNGDLSAPQGDTEDWIAFKPYDETVFVSLECSAAQALKVELIEDHLPVNFDLACGDQMIKLAVKPNSDYVIHLQAIPFSQLQYTSYRLVINTRP